jgi:murein DD-endopeptidase MepM/ murein hydrolase activator NlpD
MVKKIFKLILGVVVIGSILLAAAYFIWPLGRTIETKEITLNIPEPKYLYGLRSDSFHLETGFVGRNENLSDILSERGIAQSMIQQLAGSCSSVFDVRKMKTGDRFVAFYSQDSIRNLRYFAYEVNTIDYCVFDFTRDTAKVIGGKKQVTTKIRTASGVIKSSLWNTIKENNLNPMLAIELSEIYAWTIDFFGIQKGDHFKVLYDEEFIGNESIGIGKIHSASFTQNGKEYFAILFSQEDGNNYFDEKGNSLRKSFLKSPLKFSHITSRFSSSRLHPILRIRRPHYGVDYSAPTGTPVFSIGDGVVTQKSYQGGGGGNFLRIRHNSIFETTYMHLSGFASGVHPGSRVIQGQVIGYVGATGLATGPHLDFRVYMSGRPVDPLKIKAPPSDPVKPENMKRFALLRDSLLDVLSKPAYASVLPDHL